MPQRKSPTLISTLAISMGILFFTTSAVGILLINIQMRKQALQEAESKALLLLDHNLATHAYFTQELKPKVFEITGRYEKSDYFEPAWMSSTYAVRGIMENFQKLNPLDYYYKECAINARSVENEADEYEKTFLLEVGNDPELQKRSAVRNLDGKDYYTLLKRGEVMEESCLRCHDTPDRAPTDMVALYGAERSFNRSVGDIASVVSIRIPLSEAYAAANQLSLQLSILLVSGLFAVFATLLFITERYAIKPLSQVRDAALLIADSNTHLGKTIEKPKGRELNDLVAAFNKMSSSLRLSHDNLEQQVVERTKDLKQTNNKLTGERDKLQEALDEIKTLRGILPICASCKKIRDDKGAWNQIEVYIHERSDAEFSHGICPDCAKKLYPDIDLTEE